MSNSTSTGKAPAEMYSAHGSGQTPVESCCSQTAPCGMLPVRPHELMFREIRLEFAQLAGSSPSSWFPEKSRDCRPGRAARLLMFAARHKLGLQPCARRQHIQ